MIHDSPWAMHVTTQRKEVQSRAVGRGMAEGDVRGSGGGRGQGSGGE